MSFVDTLRQWDEAVTCADRQDWSEALSIFLSIEQPNSKICFDIGCLHLLNQELDAAEKAFDCSIRKDEHLAVAFFQRGVTFYKKERYEESSADFQRAFKALRNNQLIDYKALGLRYILYACEFQIPKKETTKMSTEPVVTQTQSPSWADRTAVGGEADNPSIHKREGRLLSRKAAKRPMVTLEELQRPTAQVLHNIALAEAQLGNWEKAQENLAKALDYKTEAKLSIIDKALQATLKQKLFKLVEFPSKTLFKPNKHYVAELEKKDYLGKAKVVASVVPQDEFSGFAPLQPQVEDGPAAPKEPEVLRALEGEAHTVLFEFVPETSDELAVVPGNIVFVLQKGADNWAYVVFNERKGLVPYNYLERLEISLGSKPAKGVARLHSRDPPSRPMRIQGLTPSSSSRNTQQQITQPTDSCFVKIHFTFNFAISVPCGSPYVVLIEKISKKLNLPSTVISLSSDSRGKHLLNNMQMTDVWSRAQDGLITLWCTTKEQNDRKSEKEIYFVALHSYQSSKPEDLSFQEGDKIRLLSRVNQDWLEGQCNGNTGIFPASFAEEVPTNEQ